MKIVTTKERPLIKLKKKTKRRNYLQWSSAMKSQGEAGGPGGESFGENVREKRIVFLSTSVIRGKGESQKN